MTKIGMRAAVVLWTQMLLLLGLAAAEEAYTRHTNNWAVVVRLKR